jgi:hypothetical protein
MVDRYTKVILTVIAIALTWIAMRPSVTTASSHQPQAVYIAQVAKSAAECIAGHVTFLKGDNGPCVYE